MSHLLPVYSRINGPAGIPLHTVAYGDAASPHKVVCVHGGLQAKECFSLLYDYLGTRDCYVVGFDLPWHGQSGPASDQDVSPTPELWADSLKAVLDSPGVHGQPVMVIAWSTGGAPVRNYLQLRESEQIVGLVLVAALLDVGLLFPYLAKENPESLDVVARLVRNPIP